MFCKKFPPQKENADLQILAPTPPKPQPEPALPKTKVNMAMHDVSVAVLLRTLARVVDVNIMINETVRGKANVNFKNLPWDQAFKGVLSTYGLTYEWKDRVLRIITVEDLQREMAIMEAQQKFEKSRKKHAVAMLAIQQEAEKLDPLVTRIVKINYADISALRDNLENYLTATVSNSDKEETNEFRGNILKDEATNSLIIQATQSDLARIMPILAKLDRPNRQILIEAHIVEANSDTARELGIQWGGLTRGHKNHNWLGGSGSVDTDSSVDDPQSPNVGPVINFPSSPEAGTEDWQGMSLGFLRQELGHYILYAQLTALEQEGKLNILSKPSITTMDHQKAVIESGREVPFQTIEDDEVAIEWKKAVIKLEVTPHVIDNRAIWLEIITHKDELDWSRTVSGNPTIITKNAETRVSLFDGQTTVIGGLNKEMLAQGESGIPLLKEIPGLGHLFKNHAKSQDMEELLIFITPHILKQDSPMVEKGPVKTLAPKREE